MNNYVYADNAATTRLDLDAYEAMRPYLLEEYGNPSQPYFFSKKAKFAVKNARKTIADCINAEPEQILFTSGGTESDNWVIKEFGLPTDLKTIVTTSIEHHAVLNACAFMQEARRATVKYLSVDKEGVIAEGDLEATLRHNGNPVASCASTLVSVMMANNEIGTIQNVKQLCQIAHKYGASFHTDAVQAVGHIPIDVRELGIDFLSASAHKFNGPKGIGFLFDSRRRLLSVFHSGGSQENGRRAGTENVAAIVGMAVALEKNCKAMSIQNGRLNKLEEDLLNGLKNSGLDFIRNGSENNHLPGNVSLSFRGSDGEMLLHRLDLMKIFVSTGSACDSINSQISHVLKAIDVPEEYARGTIRVSLGRDNTEDDVLNIVSALRRIITR